MEKKQQFRQGARDGIPIALGYFAVSFAFGMMAVTGGLTALDASLISLVNVTSAGQFAGLSALGLAIYGMFLAIIIPPAKHERNVAAAACGFAVALLLAWKEKSMVTVALAACAAVFAGEWILERMG